MKIAICLANLNVGGIAAFVETLLTGFQQHGCEVSILTTYAKGNYFDEAASEGWPVLDVARDQLSIKARLRALYEHLSGNYDVILTNHSVEAQLIFPAIESRVVCIAVQHSADLENRHLWLTKLNRDHYDAWVGVSQAATNGIVKVGKFDGRVRTIPNGLSLKTEYSRERTSDSMLSLIYVGRVESKLKNVLCIADIALCLASRNTEFVVSVVGDGPAMLELRQKISRLQLDDYFLFHGNVPKARTLELMADQDFVLLPSFAEGLSFVLLEAMALEVLPITSNIPEFTWVLGGSSEALVSDPLQPEQFADKILSIHRDELSARQLRVVLRDRQAERFSGEACVESYLGLIDEISSEKEDLDVTEFDDLSFPFWVYLQDTVIWRYLQIAKRRLLRVRN